MHVGVKDKDKKWDNGNQYQNCENTNIPTILGMWLCPARDCKDIVALRPPKKKEDKWRHLEHFIIIQMERCVFLVHLLKVWVRTSQWILSNEDLLSGKEAI